MFVIEFIFFIYTSITVLLTVFGQKLKNVFFISIILKIDVKNIQNMKKGEQNDEKLYKWRKNPKQRKITPGGVNHS